MVVRFVVSLSDVLGIIADSVIYTSVTRSNAINTEVSSGLIVGQLGGITCVWVPGTRATRKGFRNLS